MKKQYGNEEMHLELRYADFTACGLWPLVASTPRLADVTCWRCLESAERYKKNPRRERKLRDTIAGI